jgi:hypothetical protein
MDTVSISKLINHDLYAKSNIKGYDSTLTNVKNTFTSGSYIGKIYSYIVRNGIIYYMVYLTPYDYDNFIPTFIQHDPNTIDVPDLRDILQQIKNEKQIAADLAKKEQVGQIQFYIEKYGPWILGAIVVIGVFPSIFKSLTKNDK